MGFLLGALLEKIFKKGGAKGGGCEGGECAQAGGGDNPSNPFSPGGCCSGNRDMMAATECMRQGGNSTCLPNVTIG